MTQERAPPGASLSCSTAPPGPFSSLPPSPCAAPFPIRNMRSTPTCAQNKARPLHPLCIARGMPHLSRKDTIRPPSFSTPATFDSPRPYFSVSCLVIPRCAWLSCPTACILTSTPSLHLCIAPVSALYASPAAAGQSDLRRCSRQPFQLSHTTLEASCFRPAVASSYAVMRTPSPPSPLLPMLLANMRAMSNPDTIPGHARSMRWGASQGCFLAVCRLAQSAASTAPGCSSCNCS